MLDESYTLVAAEAEIFHVQVQSDVASFCGTKVS